MRVVHSFNSEYCSKEKFNTYMYYFALSCVYAKKNGFEIALHCDKDTEAVLRNAPYDEIIVDIPHIDESLKAFYAAPKFIAMKDEPLTSIHIDGDVFLKSPGLIDLMNFDKHDCITQCLELPNGRWGFGWITAQTMFDNCVYPKWANRDCKSMFNCGIVGIKNRELKDEYFKTYWEMLNRFKTNGIKTINGIPDLIVEQQFLKDLTTFNNNSVKTLLDIDNLKVATEIGYQHVIGGNKEENLQTVKLLIQQHDKETYNKVNYLL